MSRPRLPGGARRAGLQRGLARPGRRGRARSPGCAPASPARTAGTPPSARTRSARGRSPSRRSSDPYLTWRNAVTKKIDAGQGAGRAGQRPGRGRARAGRGAASSCRADRAGRVPAAARRAARRRRCRWPTRVSPALDLADLLWEHPVRELVTAGDRAPSSGWTGRGRSSPPGTSSSRARRGPWWPTGDAPARHGTFATAARPAARRRRDGLRRALPAADPPDRPGQPQGPQQRARRRAGRRRLAVGDRRRPRAATTRSTPTWVRRRTSAPSSPRPRDARAWRWRWTWRCSARRTTRGSPSTRSGSPPCPTARIAYAENPPKKYQDIYPLNFDNDPEGIRAEILRVVLHWVGAGRARSSGWTTRTPSRSTSGTG